MNRLRKDLLDRAVRQRIPADMRCPRCERELRMDTLREPEYENHNYVYRVECCGCGHAHTETWADCRPVKVVIHENP